MNPDIAKEFTLGMMDEYGLTKNGWTFEWSNARCQFGYCHYVKKVIRLSLPLTELNSEGQVLNTIMHEVAHALTPWHGHDSVWRAKAVELGAHPRSCGEGITAPPRWAGVCPTCEQVVAHRHRRPPYYTSRHCSACRKERGDTDFLPETELQWVEAHVHDSENFTSL